MTEFDLDPETLHEVYADPDTVRGRVQQLRAEVRDALDEIAGNPAQQHTARLRLAHVQQWRGEFAESNMIFTEREQLELDEAQASRLAFAAAVRHLEQVGQNGGAR